MGSNVSIVSTVCRVSIFNIKNKKKILKNKFDLFSFL